MSSRRLLIKEEVMLRTLRLIHDNPRISQREIASHVGISVGAVHYCITALSEKGLIKFGNFQASKNKRSYIYLLTPEGIAAKASLTVSFLKRKVAEYEMLRSEIVALESELGENISPEQSPA